MNTDSRVLATWYRRKSPVLRFCLGFGLLMAMFYAVTLTSFFDEVLFPAYLHGNALASNALLHCLGHDCIVAGVTIRSAHFAVTIKRGCDAFEPSWFFCAGVLSFPSRLSSKVVGILAGTTLLQLLNIVRIASLFIIGSRWPHWFARFHLEIWPATFIVAAITFWVLWVSRVARNNLGQEAHAAT